MRITRFALSFCLISILAVFSLETPSAVKSWKCRVPPVNEAYENSKAVFVGEVTKIIKDGDVKTFTFKVEKYWKGATSREIAINVRETARYQAWFEEGEKYLVYARGSEKDEKLWEARCSRTKSLADASEDIKELERVKSQSKNN